MNSPTSGEPWVCPSCQSQNFGSRLTCLNCGAEKPDIIQVPPIQTSAESATRPEVSVPPVSTTPSHQSVTSRERVSIPEKVPQPVEKPQLSSTYESASSPARSDASYPGSISPEPKPRRNKALTCFLAGCGVLFLFLCFSTVGVYFARDWLLEQYPVAGQVQEILDYFLTTDSTEQAWEQEPVFPETTNEPIMVTPFVEEPTVVVQQPPTMDVMEIQEVPDVSYAGISFSYDPHLAWAVFPSTEEAYTEFLLYPAPEHILFDFDGYPNEENSNVLPEIRIFPAGEYAQINPDAGEQIEILRQALSERPIQPNPPLPYLPMINAGKLITARIGFLDFQNGSGIRYLTQIGQDVYPINNADLLYTFQGLTSDGLYLVSASFPIQSVELPANGDEVEYNYLEFTETFKEYASDTTWLLEQARAETFIPNMDLLDEMLSTLYVSP